MSKITAKDIIKPALSLFIICLAVAVLLSVTNTFTKDRIAENEAKTKEDSMQSVVEGAVSFKAIIEDVAYTALDENGNIAGYTISTSANGYGGQIKVMTGFTTEGEIQKVDVYYNDDETPGLGKNTSNSAFSDQFSGKRAESDFTVSKDSDGNGQEIDAVTSATISSRAVVKAVNDACEIYDELKKGGQI